jgi:hypothetical protein
MTCIHHSIYFFEERTMSKNRFVSLLFVICMALAACNLPSGAPTEAPAVGDASPTPTPAALDAASPTPTAAIAPIVDCSPTVTANTDANVRGGPGQVYNILGFIPQGGTAAVAGKNFDGTWWYIQFAAGPGGHAWIAASITTATCIPATLAVIAAPPTPVAPPTDAPTNTPVPGAPPSATPTNWFLFPIDPGLIIVFPSATPTISFVIPTFDFDIPCIFGC